MCKFLSFVFCLCLLTACVSTPPNKDYALAQSVLLMAKQFEADKLSPNYYSKALSLYKKAVSLYKRQKYEEAGSSFEESIKLAEKAELKARVKKFREQE